MGCYDTLLWKCPNCGCQNEEQSKAGECNLSKFRLSTAPLSVLADVQETGERGQLRCPGCNCHYRLDVQRIVQLVPYEPDTEDGG